MDPIEVVNQPPAQQQYCDDPTRWCVAVFKDHGISLETLQQWTQDVDIIYPWHNNYNTLRLGYNRHYQYYPLAIIMAPHVRDIQWALNKAIELNLRFSIRGGGHCHVGSSLSDGIIINMSRRNNVKLYKDYMRIGAGALLGHVEEALNKVGGVAPFGTCMNVGACGLALGLGVGLYIRKYGATLDNILSVSIILASGEQVIANEHQYADLFWALRGAGACNFGIVTDLKLKYYPLASMYMYKMRFNLEQFKTIFNMWQKFAPYAPHDLASKCCLAPVSDKSSTYSLTIKGHFLGPKAGLLKLIKPFLDQSVKHEIWTATPYEAAVFHNEACKNPPWFFAYQTLFANSVLSSKTIDVLYDFILTAPDECSIIVNALGGKFGEVASNATAFPWRDSIMWLHLASETRDQRRFSIMERVINDLYHQLLNNGMRQPGKSVGRLYCNFKDTNLTPAEYMQAYYGPNADKLRTIKKKYDPEGVFDALQGII